MVDFECAAEAAVARLSKDFARQQEDEVAPSVPVAKAATSTMLVLRDWFAMKHAAGLVYWGPGAEQRTWSSFSTTAALAGDVPMLFMGAFRGVHARVETDGNNGDPMRNVFFFEDLGRFSRIARCRLRHILGVPEIVSQQRGTTGEPLRGPQRLARSDCETVAADAHYRKPFSGALDEVGEVLRVVRGELLSSLVCKDDSHYSFGGSKAGLAVAAVTTLLKGVGERPGNHSSALSAQSDGLPQVGPDTQPPAVGFLVRGFLGSCFRRF